MALDTKQDLGGNASEAAVPPIVLDRDLVNRYLELQVSWLNLQLEAARREAAENRDDATLAITTVRLWHQAAPTAMIVLLLGGAVALLSALTWNDLWRGLSAGQPDDLMFLTSQQTNVSSQVRALGDLMREWKDVFLWIVGGGVLLAFKRLAYRSLRSAVVIALALILSFSLIAGLVIADLHLVQNDLAPMHVTWRGWAALALAIAAGVVLSTELCEIALSSPAAFQAQSRLSGGFRQWISTPASKTWFGRFLGWLTTPQGRLRWLASLGVVTAISVVLCVPGLIGAIVTNGADLWAIIFTLAFPLGPIWWLLVLAVVASSPAGREPARTRLPFAIFALAPALALAVFIAILLSPGFYDMSGNTSVGLGLLAVLAIEIWAFWFLWAGITVSVPMRIVYLPVVLGCAVTIPMYYGLLPFLGLMTVLSVGVPWSVWRLRPAPAAA